MAGERDGGDGSWGGNHVDMWGTMATSSNPHLFLFFLFFTPPPTCNKPPFYAHSKHRTATGPGCRASSSCSWGGSGERLSLFGSLGLWVVLRSSVGREGVLLLGFGVGLENMPRPGPRPYECVRRVWHSERHQAMRGTLVQEMIRVVSELHGSATQKNKEWQEKLPIVILRAEEIMYSKANSEEEYMDFKTIRKRLDDAIDTIIRKDETEIETGNLLRPCIEAALVLGCVARRASRSQRHNNPKCYLSSSTQELIEAYRSMEKPSYSGPFRMFPNPNVSISTPFPQQRPYFPNFVTPPENATHLVTVPRSHMHKGLSASHTSDFHSVPSSFNHHLQPNILESPTVSLVPSCFNHRRQPNILEFPTVSPSSHCSIYPLYYISEQPNKIKAKTEYEGMDLNVEPDAWKISPETSDVANAFEVTPAKGLDLSLQLGPPSSSDTQDMNLLDMDSKKVCNAAKPFDMSTSASSGQVASSSVPKLFMFFPTVAAPK